MANEKRLIDANALTDDTYILNSWDAPIVRAWLDDQPTVDAVEVVHAYWIKEYDEHGIDRGWKCSNCKGSVYEMTYEPYKGCPHCLAKMDGDGNG